MTFWQIGLAWLLIGTCLLLMLVILLQRGRGGGLAGAFGGGGGSSAFGAKTGDVFTWITVILAGVFVTLAVVANFVFEPAALASSIDAQATSVDTPVPATPITIPTGEGTGIDKIELLTKDGQVIPIETNVVPEAGGSAPGEVAAPDGEVPKTGVTPTSDTTKGSGDGDVAPKEADDAGGAKEGGAKDPGK